MSGDAAHPSPASPGAAPGAAPGADHPHANYFKIWWYLLFLTVGEVAVVYILPRGLVLGVSLVAFAVAKAILVAAYFMHLKFERRVLWLIAAAPAIFAVILTIGLVPDSEKGLQGSKRDPELRHAQEAAEPVGR